MIVDATQLRKGFKIKENPVLGFHQPLQMVPNKEKTDYWRASNLDWLEYHGMKQITDRLPRHKKQWEMRQGVLNIVDYSKGPKNPEFQDIIDTLERADDPSMEYAEMRFFPLIPVIIDTLLGEFMKRNTSMEVMSVDEISINEKLEFRKQSIDEILVAEAQGEMMKNAQAAGVDIENEEFQQSILPESIKSLPQFETWFKKSYRDTVEQMAAHVIEDDNLRFNMYEMENLGFEDLLTSDKELWHINLKENDYEPELWSCLNSFYHKSPTERWIQNGELVGKIDLMTVSQVIAAFPQMVEQELLSLEDYYGYAGPGYLLIQPNDGSYYDMSKSYEWNTSAPSLNMRQVLAKDQLYGGEFLGKNNNDPLEFLKSISEENYFERRDLCRVTTAYWKTFRKMFHLTKITRDYQFISTIVDESYEVTDKPEYDMTFYKEKTANNVTYGEHMETIWVPEVYGGVKISPNNGINFGPVQSDFSCIYLGVAGDKRPGRVKCQFKGTDSLYGCHLPVIGFVASERNVESRSMVDRLIPYQIPYNMFCNQIVDITIDEIGSFIVGNPNFLPKNSLGEDWGKANYIKAMAAARTGKYLPQDTSAFNVETPQLYQAVQQVDLSENNRITSRIQLAEWVKNQAFEAIGITQNRRGEPTSRESGTSQQITLSNSYKQTEKYFVQHLNYLMPKVREAMIQANLYYTSSTPSKRISYLNDKGERILREFETDKLYPRDVNVYCTSSPVSREFHQWLENFLLSNNNLNMGIYDTAKIKMANSASDIEVAIKVAEEKRIREMDAQRSHEQQVNQEMIASQAQQLAAAQQFEAEQNQLDRENDILEAEIKAAGYGGMVDINENKQNDYIDNLQYIQKQQEMESKTQVEREKNATNSALKIQEFQVQREAIAAKRQESKDKVTIAIKNKNQYDKAPKKKK